MEYLYGIIIINNIGLINGYIMVNGNKVHNTAKDHRLVHKVKKEKEYGSMDILNNGYHDKFNS